MEAPEDSMSWAAAAPRRSRVGCRHGIDPLKTSIEMALEMGGVEKKP